REPHSGRKSAVIIRAAAWLLGVALLGSAAGLLHTGFPRPGIEVGRGRTWLLAWAVLGGLGAVLAAAAAMRTLARSLTGPGTCNDPLVFPLHIGAAAHTFLAAPLFAVSRLLGCAPAGWPWSETCCRAGRWSGWDASARGQGARLRRSLPGGGAPAPLPAGVNVVLGSLGGVLGGLLVGGFCRSIGPAVAAGSLFGLALGMALLNRA